MTASRDSELAHVLARQMDRRVGHLLPEDVRAEFYGTVVSATEALFLTRDGIARGAT